MTIIKERVFFSSPPPGTRVKVSIRRPSGCQHPSLYKATTIPHPTNSKPRIISYDDWEAHFVHVIIDGETTATSYHIDALYEHNYNHPIQEPTP